MGIRHEALGQEPQQGWLAAHYQLARLYQARNEKQKARQVLDALLKLLKDADPDLPLLKKATQLRAQLEG